MQFTESPNPSLHQKLSTFSNLPMDKPSQAFHRTRPWPGLPTSNKDLQSYADTNCMEQLLVHCANAIQTNDSTLAQQILWVLNNIAPSDGDSNQRLTCCFLRALIARAAKTGTCKILTQSTNYISITTHKFSIIELTNFVDLTPWHRFGFTAANSSILEAVEGYSVIHIVDLSLTHCMQIPTLLDAIATRLEGPPVVKLTVAGPTEDFPPMLDLSYEELGTKLVNFARSRNIIMEFLVIPSSSSNGFVSLIEALKINQATVAGEALVINCHMMLHYVPEEAVNYSSSSIRSMLLKSIRDLDPTIVVVVDEDADFTSSSLVSRIRSAFNYLWIPFDSVDTFLSRGSKLRQWYEADICWKIENTIAYEGVQRVERLEPKSRWVQRMRSAGFRGVGFGEEAVGEVKSMLDEHAAGWGLKREDDHLLLTWKGHNVVFATAWVPS